MSETRETFCIRCKSDIEINLPEGCYCNEDQGAGYSYHDEHGRCDVCESEVFYCPVCKKELG